MVVVVFVESPAKCKKIEGFLGRGYKVIASFGHIRDLKKGLKDSIDIENNFKPSYRLIDSKMKVIKDLKRWGKKATEVIIASDLDREGEAIGFHVAKILGLNLNNTKRIIFNQITKKAVLKALNNPTRLDMNLFNSQQARRILDRLVGFELTPLLWKFVKLNLSAGRCQSPAVRLVYDRENEIHNFDSQLYYEIKGMFQVLKNKYPLEGIFVKNYTELQDVEQLLKHCAKANFEIAKISERIGENKPPPPFTTSSLQQEASSKLGISPKNCMMIAQKLYEAGKITYMRTDSVDLSEEALGMIKEHIIEKYGKKNYEFRKYKTKSKGSQEAHEAIRPVYPNVSNVEGSFGSSGKKLYNLIYKRTIASQMKSSQKRVFTIMLKMNNRDDLVKCVIEKIIYLGFLKLYGVELSKPDKLLTTLAVGDKVKYNIITATQKYTKSKGRYTEASLIKELEKKGIGRPSTFSNLITTIQNREYVIKDTRPGVQKQILTLTLQNKKIKKTKDIITTGTEKNKLFLTDTGKMVIEFLIKHFPNLMNYDFTSQIESMLDEVANGRAQWHQIVKSVYDTFHPTVATLKKEKTTKRNNHKSLGTYRRKPVIAFLGQYGPVVQVGNNENKKLNQYYRIPRHISLDNITLQDVKHLMKFPIELGKYKNKEMIIKKGPYGCYINWGDQNISMPKKKDKTNMTEDEILALTKNQVMSILRKTKKKVIQEIDDELQVLNGPYGPYIKYKKKYNISVPKDVNPETLTKEQCLEIIERKYNKTDKKKTKTTTKKTTAKKTKTTAKKTTAKKTKTTAKKTTVAKKTTAKKRGRKKKDN